MKRAVRHARNKATKVARRINVRPFVETINTLQAKILDPFPQRKWALMRYSDNYLLTGPNTNLSYEQIFSLNSLFKPDVTNTGHQPYGFDTMAVLYNNYLVHGCRVDLEWYDPTADGVIVGYRIQGSSVSASTVSALEEAPWTTLKSISNTGDQKVIQRIFIQNPQCLGLTKDQYTSDTNQYGAAVTASPTQQTYLRLAVLSTQGGASSSIKLKITLTYGTMFWNRVTLTQSS